MFNNDRTKTGRMASSLCVTPRICAGVRLPRTQSSARVLVSRMALRVLPDDGVFIDTTANSVWDAEVEDADDAWEKEKETEDSSRDKKEKDKDGGLEQVLRQLSESRKELLASAFEAMQKAAERESDALLRVASQLRDAGKDVGKDVGKGKGGGDQCRKKKSKRDCSRPPPAGHA